MSRKTHGQIYATGLYLSSSSSDFLFFPYYWRGSIYIIACVGACLCMQMMRQRFVATQLPLFS